MLTSRLPESPAQPDNATAAVGLANAHYALGALKEAEMALRDAVRKDPDSVIALNNLALTWSNQGDLRTARNGLFERSVGMQIHFPGNPSEDGILLTGFHPED